MRKLMLGLALGALVACGGGTTVTGPEDVTSGETTTAVAGTPVVAPVAAPVTPSADVEAWIGNFGKFYAKNLAGAPAVFVFYTTSFDKQTYTAGDPKQTMTVQPGDFMEGSFDVVCRQVDGAFNNTDGRIFVSAFINHEGKSVPANQIDRTKCSPTPRQTCEPTWTTSTTYTVEKGTWSNTEESCGTRSVTWVYTETNSCTQETRPLRVSQADETEECKVNICHTENPKNCEWVTRWYKNSNYTGGSRSYQQGDYKYSRLELDCEDYDDDNFSEQTSGFKLYQCQNKKDKKSGHVPNHHGGGDHADYLGTCKLATSADHSSPEICYNINGTPN